MKSKRILLYFILSFIFIPLIFSNYLNAKEKIRIGNSIALSGPNAPGAMMTQIRSYDMWVEDVNARGGSLCKRIRQKITCRNYSI